MRWLATIVGLVALGCGSGQSEPEEPLPSSVHPSGVYVQPAASAPAAPLGQAAPTGASHTSAGLDSERDAPEISRSVGEEGGIVVLWPRIVMPRSGPSKPDAETIALARRVQQQLAALVRRTLPKRRVDVRPEPERVCPRSGCRASTVGTLLARAGGGCAAIVLVSPPGPSAARVVPWAGALDIKSETVAFREPPERAVGVRDYHRCDTLLSNPPAIDSNVEAALRALR